MVGKFKVTPVDISLQSMNARGLPALNNHDTIQFNSALEFIKIIDFTGVKSVADLGAGPGHQAFVMQQLGLEVTCIDYVKPQYDIPWRHPDDTNGLSFDAIWSHHCLEHIPNPISALTTWRKLLNPRGQFFLTVPEIGLTMSTGHLNSYSIPLLMYHLAISGYKCSGKRFVKSRCHLRAWVEKAENYFPERDGHIHQLSELARLNLFPPSVTNAIEKKGRFSAEDMHLSWSGSALSPQINAINAYEFVSSQLWGR